MGASLFFIRSDFVGRRRVDPAGKEVSSARREKAILRKRRMAVERNVIFDTKHSPVGLIGFPVGL